MKLTKKQLIIIAVALVAVIIAVVAIVAIADENGGAQERIDGKTVTDVTPVTYVRNTTRGKTETEGKAVIAGDFYWMDWTERRNVVRGTYDDAAGTMENWGDELPLCDAGLANLKEEYVDGYEWSHWYDDNYTYDWEYYCEFNRADKTYVRSTEMESDGYGFSYHEADGWQYVAQIMGTVTDADGGIYCFKDGLCYGYEASLYQYERKVQDGKDVLVLLDTDGDMIDDELYIEDRGDTLYFTAVNQSCKKVNDKCYVMESDEGPMYILLIDDHQLIAGGGRSMGVMEDVQLNYEPGKRLEIVHQGQTLGYRVEGDVLIANVSGFGGRKEYRLVRQGVDQNTIDPAALLIVIGKCDSCETEGMELKQVEFWGDTMWVCPDCEEGMFY